MASAWGLSFLSGEAAEHGRAEEIYRQEKLMVDATSRNWGGQLEKGVQANAVNGMLAVYQ